MNPHFSAVFALTGFAIVITGALTQYAKQIIELSIPATGPKQTLHDVVVQGVAIVLGVMSIAGLVVAFGPAMSIAETIFDVIVFGVAVGFAAMGNYLMLTKLAGGKFIPSFLQKG